MQQRMIRRVCVLQRGNWQIEGTTSDSFVAEKSALCDHRVKSAIKKNTRGAFWWAIRGGTRNGRLHSRWRASHWRTLDPSVAGRAIADQQRTRKITTEARRLFCSRGL